MMEMDTTRDGYEHKHERHICITRFFQQLVRDTI